MTFESPFNQGDIQRAVERHGQTHDRGGDDELYGIVPVGGMIDWWGVATSVPVGWRIVDGTFEVNGMTVPDMAGKFSRGAGGVLDLGMEGGAEDHQHTPPVVDDLLHDHNHDNSTTHTHDSTGSQTLTHVGHGHVLNGDFYEVALDGASGAFVPRQDAITSSVTVTQHSVNSHQHSGTGTAHGHAAHSDHAIELDPDSEESSLPPYACFYKIMRVR